MNINERLLSTPKLWERENDIIQWGIDRNIIGNTAQGTFGGQQEKTRQEWQEWKRDHSKDDVGDIMVTLMMGLALKHTTLSQCVKYYYRGGKELGWDYQSFPSETSSGWFDFFLDSAVTDYLEVGSSYEETGADIVNCLYNLCEYNQWTLEECLEVAWNDIKDRRGLMCYGSFVKQTNIDTLSKYNVHYDEVSQSFKGVVSSSKDLEMVTNTFYNLGFTYEVSGEYSSGFLIETTGVGSND